MGQSEGGRFGPLKHATKAFLPMLWSAVVGYAAGRQQWIILSLMVTLAMMFLIVTTDPNERQ